MKTKLSLILLTFLTAGCAWWQNSDYHAPKTCPKVRIKAEDNAIQQFVGGQNLFEIKMIGSSGYCYYDEKALQTKAVVRPIFHLTRLSESNVEDVHFSYYLETAEGPARFLGKKTYFAEVRMTKGVWNMDWQAPESDGISVPAGEYDVEMYAGLYAVKADSEEKVQ